MTSLSFWNTLAVPWLKSKDWSRSGVLRFDVSREGLTINKNEVFVVVDFCLLRNMKIYFDWHFRGGLLSFKVALNTGFFFFYFFTNHKIGLPLVLLSWSGSNYRQPHFANLSKCCIVVASSHKITLYNWLCFRHRTYRFAGGVLSTWESVSSMR